MSALSPIPAADPWASLNPEQRAAVEHGEAAVPGTPLLVIAGAGSGKTNTLAWRVARLVRDGADPSRILLLTFSRRAAAEMEARAGRVLGRMLGQRAWDRPPALPWGGTFHGVGARLLREYAPRIGLADSFTIHDRGDSEDLLALVRHELALDTTRARFPAKATCLAIYSRAVNAEAQLADVLAGSRERYTKNLWTDRASTRKPRLVTVREQDGQARYVAEHVLAEREEGATLKSQAVLFRSSSHSAQLELELARRGIPFVKYGGLRFLEAAHVKDVLAVLRFAENPRARIAGFRAARLLPGVGAATAARLLDALDAAADPVAAVEAFAPPAATAGDWGAFVELFRTRRHA